MERMCGDFQGKLGSKSAPASSIDKRVLHGAYLDQLDSRFNLNDELDEVGKRPKGALLRGETIKPGCEYVLAWFLCNLIMFFTDDDHVLRTPHKKTYRPDDNTRRMIADYFRELTKASRNTIKARLPQNMPLWGKFRMAQGGDSVRCTMATSKKRSERNMSFVRVSVTVVEM